MNDLIKFHDLITWNWQNDLISENQLLINCELFIFISQ